MSQFSSSYYSPKASTNTRYHYSFSRSKRFNQIQTNCLSAFYGQQQSPKRGGYKVGKSKRSDFTKLNYITPAPNSYSIESSFEKDLRRNRGKTFGVSREDIKEQSYLDYAKVRNPGVGQYSSIRNELKTSYTMRPKTTSSWLPNFLQDSLKMDQPGPGDYDNLNMNSNGITVNARYKNIKAHSIGRQSRFTSVQHHTPGPCNYYIPDAINDSGTYTESKHRGQGKRIICREQRKCFIDIIVDKLKSDNLEKNNRGGITIKGYDSEQ